MTTSLSSIDTILSDAKAGKMFILIDDEDRENEGDLVIPAEFADAAAVNFMAKHGRGLICLALSKSHTEQLQLGLMARHNESRHQTAFTTSIEARHGISTGISAADRALTIQTAINPQVRAADIVSPGHIFPLVARDGGVLVRAGHTEAAVDIARLAGCNSAGVICEIMNDDGSMARLPDLIEFAQQHGLNIATIADLIAHRRMREKLVERVIETKMTSRYGGEFDVIVYRNTLAYAEHVVLIKGDIAADAPTLVRMHAVNPLADILGDVHDGTGSLLHQSMQAIEQAGSGVVVLLREPVKTALSDRFKSRLGEPTEHPMDLRDYGIGAQILLDLGIYHMTLLSNSKRAVVGLEGYGIEIAGWQEIADPK